MRKTTKSLAVSPIERKKLSDEIAEQLQNLILSGKLEFGDLLPSERDLMALFGVSRTSIREAIFTLQKMGLIAIRNGERALVTRPTASNLIKHLSGVARLMLAESHGVQEFQQARQILETSIAKLAAEVRSKEDLADLRAALEANEAALGNLKRFAETDVQFHYVIARISRNSIFTALHRSASEWLSDQRMISLRIDGADEAAYADHKKIYEAIEAGDKNAAEAAMGRHLGQVEKRYWAARGTGE
jgi:DNA-binding FadR family transcriptional regulator